MRTIESGLSEIGGLTVLPNGTLFVANELHFVDGNPTNGNVVAFAPGASSPEVTISNVDDTNADGTAYRPALR